MKINGRTRRMVGALVLAAVAMANGLVRAELPVDGKGHIALTNQVDPLIKSMIRDANLPGVTVAVTRNGRLLMSKGYGYADAPKGTPMRANMRANIGSVSKAVVTGPAAFQAMREKNINYRTKPLYGLNGIFGLDFQFDTTVGRMRHQPILATAISPKDKVFAWYTDGTRSVGSSSDLDKFEPPKPFKLPSGKRIADVRAIAIAKNSRVYTWYDDRSMSIGTSTDLGKYKKPRPDEVRGPGNRSILDVVGIAIAKSDDHVYYFYDDKTCSSGTSTNLSYYFAPRPFRIASHVGVTGTGIRGVGIAKDDRVYYWFSNNRASTGTTSDATAHAKAYRYFLPQGVDDGPDLRAWYGQITPQHLLDHTAGFVRSGDGSGTARMFGTTPEKASYKQIHQHFLRTRKLMSKPGKSYSYSNHGMGLMTLVVEKLTGKSYRQYAQDNYLAPMGLKGDVRPESIYTDGRDSKKHVKSGNRLVTVPFKNSGTGLAAGGWRSSAEDLARVMKTLDSRYSFRQIDAMGWHNDNGQLHHNGKSSGTAYVSMYPSDSPKIQMRGIHVAVVTNIGTSPTPLIKAAKTIASKVKSSGVPSGYNLWPATRSAPINRQAGR